MPLIYHIVLALGVLHALVLIAFLFRARALNVFGFTNLLIVVTAITLIVLEEWVVASGQWRRFPHILRLTAWMPFLIGPSIYLFVVSLKRPQARIADLLHFGPAIFSLFVYAPFYILNGESKISAVNNTHVIPIWVSILGGTKGVSMITYLLLSCFGLARVESENQSRLVKYGQAILIVFLSVVISMFVLFGLEHVVDKLPISSDLLSVLLVSILVYGLSFTTILHWREFALDVDPKRPNDSATEHLLDTETTTVVFSDIEEKIEKLSLYREPDMRLSELAERLGVKPHFVSYVVNRETGQNFQSWINEFRIEYATQQLISENNKSILSIGLEAGFNSKASFNRVFRAKTGESPSEYRKKGLTL